MILDKDLQIFMEQRIDLICNQMYQQNFLKSIINANRLKFLQKIEYVLNKFKKQQRMLQVRNIIFFLTMERKVEIHYQAGCLLINQIIQKQIRMNQKVVQIENINN
ncbi:unnamed protein product [Paramecium sonneborni]|uniref:Uncharacterized protein n=1 Tax=Paramecium sonneborni TaxID=65129 RepID=A0A8S1RBI0_9CILI|nr:unnamed protein product [Paramecium sonneborni]